MPDVVFNLLLLFSAVIFLGVFLRALNVTRARRRSAGTKSSGEDALGGDGGGEVGG